MDWKSHNYEVTITGDGSPSLKAWRDPSVIEAYESMHHSVGAWGETLYIYGAALRLLRELHWEGQVMSLGLGLGYNELLASALLDKSLRSLTSFEADPFLWERFREALTGTVTSGEISTVYTSIFQLVKVEFPSFEPTALVQHTSWSQQGRLDLEWVKTAGPQNWNCILYDAFSAKTNAELWDEDFLVSLLQAHTTADCIFATYACRGSLKRAIQRTGFSFIERPAFHGRRNSTLALRLSSGSGDVRESLIDFLKRSGFPL